ncbi:hypothetical protein H2200_003410 [Cladophialophora chaetospira]|uniref:Uncharacterized protein n=1 Tax=Cladophialophora chaetospira TaxID=386627 RepID=A0AA38XHA5_9EURO|nr:hypothetical protein H2200_003410 [Cladophialophora chaetospira]
MCIPQYSKPQMALLSANDPVDRLRAMFPDPERPVWEQFFSERHRQLYEAGSSMQGDGEIFQIFQRANFSCLSKMDGLSKPVDAFLDPHQTISQLCYDRMLPALSLATRLIKATPFFFYTVMFGRIGRDGDGNLIYHRDEKGNWTYDLEEGTDIDSKVQEMFRRMTNIQFFTGPAPDNVDYAFAHASHNFYPAKKFQGPSGRQVATSAVQLHTKWMRFFSRDDYDNVPDHIKDRLLVLLAITLVHELVHVWYAYRKYELARAGNIAKWMALDTEDVKTDAVHPRDPYFFGDEQYGELGLAWERYAFNGDAKLDWSEGSCYSQSNLLMLHPSGLQAESTVSEGSKLAPIIAPVLVQAFLNKDYWAKMKTPSNHRRHVETLELFHKMEKVFVSQIFTRRNRRSPCPPELIVLRTVEQIDQAAKRKWLPPTPPQTPPPPTAQAKMRPRLPPTPTPTPPQTPQMRPWLPPTPPATPPQTLPTEHRKPRTAAPKQIRTDTLMYYDGSGRILEVIHH